MLNAIFRPVDNWPGNKTPAYSRKRAPFRAAYPKRLDALENELNHLRAKDIVIQAYFSLNDIRSDGWPRSSARPSEPGIIVSFLNNSRESFSYPCDTYDAWEDNLYAIALSLQALRAVDRYGVTKRGEQYEGFRRLNPPQTIDPRTLAESFICSHAGVSLADLRSDLRGAYKIAARKLHPDFVGHDELFKQLRHHIQVLERTN